MATKLHLEDFGQDFTYFIVDDDKVTEAGPFQNWLWAGRKIKPRVWRKGSQIVFEDGSVLKYRVTRVEPTRAVSPEAVS